MGVGAVRGTGVQMEAVIQARYLAGRLEAAVVGSETAASV